MFDAVTSIRTRAERPRAADRLFRQPVDAGLLHGRRRRLGRLPPGQDDAVQPARPDAPHPRDQRRRGGRLPERADRRRRAGRDDLRQLGRRAGRRRLPGSSASPTRSACWRSCKREHDGARIPHIVFTKGGGPWLRGDRARSAPTCSASTGPSNLGAARARVGDRVALQGNLDPTVLFARADADPSARSRKRARQLRPAAHGRRQPAPATSSTSATASASTRRRSTCGAGRRGARAFRAAARAAKRLIAEARHQGVP